MAESQIPKKPIKTYFYTSTEETKLPDDFLVSKNVKYIHVLHCRCVYNEGLAGDIELHASFIQRHDYRDSFVCYTNTILTKYKKYEVVRPRPRRLCLLISSKSRIKDSERNVNISLESKILSQS